MRTILLALIVLSTVFAVRAADVSQIERLPGVESGNEEVDPSVTRALTSGESRRASYRLERLIDRATDPTAWLMQFHVRDRWIVPVSDAASEENELQIRPNIPFLAWDQVHIFRAEVNYNVDVSGGNGLDEVRLFDVLVFDGWWGRWGVGPGVQMKPNSTSEGEFAAGLAAATVSKSKHWTVGLLSENLFGDGTAESFLEPTLAYKFDERWSLSVGEMKFEYDWLSGAWNRVPLSLSLDYMSELGGQKIRWFINPVYNLRNSSGEAEWMFNFGLDLLAPDA